MAVVSPLWTGCRANVLGGLNLTLLADLNRWLSDAVAVLWAMIFFEVRSAFAGLFQSRLQVQA